MKDDFIDVRNKTFSCNRKNCNQTFTHYKSYRKHLNQHKTSIIVNSNIMCPIENCAW